MPTTLRSFDCDRTTDAQPTARWLFLVGTLSLPLAVIAAEDLFPSGWAFMWTLAISIYAACKWVTFVRAKPGASNGRIAGYLFAWPGLDADRFLLSNTEKPETTAHPSAPSASEWLRAIAATSTGLLLLFVLPRNLSFTPADVVAWCGMIGVVLSLHFGLFALLSCLWRASGVDAPPLMDAPWRSTSLAEFWGRRWNNAFRDFGHEVLFRPFAKRGKPLWGLFIVFFFSGLVHDLVISLPAGGGYGRPTLYFLMQWAGLLAERSRLGRHLGLGKGREGWVFTVVVLLLPIDLLFHESFRNNVVLPMLADWGAWR